MIINGGTGNGYAAKVTEDSQVATMSSQVPQSAYESDKRAGTYLIQSSSTNLASTSYNLFFRNTDPTQNFYVQNMVFGSSIAAQFTVYLNSTYAASTGTVITPVNAAAASGKIAVATCLGVVAVATITPGKLIKDIFIPASSSIILQFDGSVILGLNNDIAIKYTAGSGTNLVSSAIMGYYKKVA